VCCSETWVTIYQTAQRHIPEKYILHSHRRGNLKSHRTLQRLDAAEKLTDARFLKKFPEAYGIHKYVAMFTGPQHWSLSPASWMQSIQASCFFTIYFNIIFLPAPTSSMLLFSLRFYYQICYTFVLSPMQATWVAHLILLDVIIRKLCLTGSINYRASRYEVFSSLLSLHPSLMQIFSSAPCSHISSVYVGFEVITVVGLKSYTFWGITPCIRCFLPASCWYLMWLIFRHWRWRQYFPPKLQLIFSWL
jgi:hypothetical protein